MMILVPDHVNTDRSLGRLVKSAPGTGSHAFHKYISKKPDGKGSWIYTYRRDDGSTYTSEEKPKRDLKQWGDTIRGSRARLKQQMAAHPEGGTKEHHAKLADLAVQEAHVKRLRGAGHTHAEEGGHIAPKEAPKPAEESARKYAHPALDPKYKKPSRTHALRPSDSVAAATKAGLTAVEGESGLVYLMDGKNRLGSIEHSYMRAPKVYIKDGPFGSAAYKKLADVLNDLELTEHAEKAELRAAYESNNNWPGGRPEKPKTREEINDETESRARDEDARARKEKREAAADKHAPTEDEVNEIYKNGIAKPAAKKLAIANRLDLSGVPDTAKGWADQIKSSLQRTKSYDDEGNHRWPLELTNGMTYFADMANGSTDSGAQRYIDDAHKFAEVLEAQKHPDLSPVVDRIKKWASANQASLDRKHAAAADKKEKHDKRGREARLEDLAKEGHSALSERASAALRDALNSQDPKVVRDALATHKDASHAAHRSYEEYAKYRTNPEQMAIHRTNRDSLNKDIAKLEEHHKSVVKKGREREEDDHKKKLAGVESTPKGGDSFKRGTARVGFRFDGKTHIDVPGAKVIGNFAVHKPVHGVDGGSVDTKAKNRVLTHLPSGFSMGSFDNEEQATRAAALWHKHAEHFGHDMKFGNAEGHPHMKTAGKMAEAIRDQVTSFKAPESDADFKPPTSFDGPDTPKRAHDPVAYNSGLAGRLGTLKKTNSNIESVTQNYKGTGKQSHKRQIVVSFKDGQRPIDFFLDKDRVEMTGVYETNWHPHIKTEGRSLDDVVKDVSEAIQKKRGGEIKPYKVELPPRSGGAGYTSNNNPPPAKKERAPGKVGFGATHGEFKRAGQNGTIPTKGYINGNYAVHKGPAGYSVIHTPTGAGLPYQHFKEKEQGLRAMALWQKHGEHLFHGHKFGETGWHEHARSAGKLAIAISDQAKKPAETDADFTAETLSGPTAKSRSAIDPLAPLQKGRYAAPNQETDMEKMIKSTPSLRRGIRGLDGPEPMAKGLYKFSVSMNATKLPDEYLMAYLDAFIEEATEHEMQEKAHSLDALTMGPAPGDVADAVARWVFNELVAHMPNNANLLNAAQKCSCSLAYIAARIRDMGIIKPLASTRQDNGDFMQGYMYSEAQEANYVGKSMPAPGTVLNEDDLLKAVIPLRQAYGKQEGPAFQGANPYEGLANFHAGQRNRIRAYYGN